LLRCSTGRSHRLIPGTAPYGATLHVRVSTTGQTGPDPAGSGMALCAEIHAAQNQDDRAPARTRQTPWSRHKLGTGKRRAISRAESPAVRQSKSSTPLMRSMGSWLKIVSMFAPPRTMSTLASSVLKLSLPGPPNS